MAALFNPLCNKTNARNGKHTNIPSKSSRQEFYLSREMCSMKEWCERDTHPQPVTGWLTVTVSSPAPNHVDSLDNMRTIDKMIRM